MPTTLRQPWYFWLAALAIALPAIYLRAWPSESFRGAGFDEILYRVYAQTLDAGHYDEVAQVYIVRQQRPEATAELPPTRFLYTLSGWLWKQVQFGDAPAIDTSEPDWTERDPYLLSLRHVAATATILLVFAGAAAAWRMVGAGAALATFALLGCSPLGLHMSQHAFIDGFFALWATLALWALWENLQKPDSAPWLALYGVSLAAMVLTKENAFFVFVALLAILLLNAFLRFGHVRLSLWAVTLLAPGFALAILIAIAGTPEDFIQIYRLLVAKASHLDYAITTGDGPWYRYLVDLLLLSPFTLCLALAAAFTLLSPQSPFRSHPTHREELTAPGPTSPYLFLLTFIGATYLIMCNVRYGMNLRYATIWDFPLRLLAYTQLACSTAALPRRHRSWILPAFVALLCLYDLRQYHTFFIQGNLYELIPKRLLQALQILK